MRLIDADALYRLYSRNTKGERIPEKDCDNFPITVSIADIKKDIKDAPTVDAVAVVRGQWLPIPDDYGHLYQGTCSQCRCEPPRRTMSFKPYNYCPNCGAKTAYPTEPGREET